MAEKSRTSLLVEAVLTSIGLMVFSFFIHFEFPVRFICFVALFLTAFLISRNLEPLPKLITSIGLNIKINFSFIFILLGVTAGIMLAVFYRWYYDLGLFPKSVHLFVLVAALIGSMEELVFRGFLQNMVKSVNGLFSILFSTISHTGYKCFLFMAPTVGGNINIGLLFFWTFGVGFLFGTIRHYSKSVLIPIAAHAFFDILVYAEYSNAPWWVW